MNHKLYALVMVAIPVPLLIFAERIWGKRKDWQLEPRELAEDGFWLAFGAFLWGPLIGDFYRTPISEGFRAIHDRALLDITDCAGKRNRSRGRRGAASDLLELYLLLAAPGAA